MQYSKNVRGVLLVRHEPTIELKITLQRSSKCRLDDCNSSQC